MGDKNPKKQKKKKRVAENPGMAPSAVQNEEVIRNIRPKKQSRGR